MARKPSPRRPAPSGLATTPRASRYWPWAALAAAVAVMHWIPLTSATAGIQWDAVDVHYSAQKYFADSVRAGALPHWTPYIFSGFPFLADPQTGAWYPLNWPFFLFGVTPRSIQGELALHTLLAAAGAFLLGRRLLGGAAPALVAAIAYAMSGFFAGHASHVGMSQTAAWLPWLLLAIGRAIEKGGRRWMPAAGAVGGLMILAGHFQSALYSMAAAAIWSAALCVGRRELFTRAAAALAAGGAIAAALAAVQTLPGLELTGQSVRSAMSLDRTPNAALTPASLATLVWADASGAVGGNYRGPADITQHYLYAGALLLPLAMIGVWWGAWRPSAAEERRPAMLALFLLLPALWYALGPAGGLYRLVTTLPGFASVRAPVHAWFVCALALALLAGAGAKSVGDRWKWAAAAIPAVLFADVFLWNSLWNPMAYSRNSYEERYGAGLGVFRERVPPRLPEGARLHAPYSIPALGPQNHPLDARVEATYGYNPLRLAAYAEYIAAAERNPKLLDTLGAGLRLHVPDGRFEKRPSALPRATFARRIVVGADARPLLASHDPVESAIAADAVPSHDPAATVVSIERGEQTLRVRYRAAAPSLMRVAIPYYPGWRATAGGRELPVVRADHALMGVVVPAGEGEVALRFVSRYFLAGAAISAVAAALVLIGLWKL